MSRFIPPYDVLDSRELPDGRIQLLASLWYQSDILGGRIVRVREGFVNDEESIPWYAPLLYIWLKVVNHASRSGVVHNWLYQTHRVGGRRADVGLHDLSDLKVPRGLADAVYHEAAALDGNGSAARFTKWAGVRVGGLWAYRSGPRRFQVNGNDRRSVPRTAPS